MTLPNFLVIGAGRAGTTSLHEYLAQHPEVFMSPEKSPNYFVAADELPPWEGPTLRAMARHWVSDRGAYEAIFASAQGEKAIGEVSPVYLQSRKAAGRIRELCPDARLVAVLRHPVERAYAHFLGRRRDGLERRESFAEVVADELSRPLPQEVAFGSYLGCGFYAHFLEPYYALFPRDRIRIYLFEDLVEDTPGLLADLFAFLDVDASFVVDTGRRHGSTGVIEQPVLRFLWTRSVALRTALRPHLPAGLRRLALPIFGSRLAKPPLAPDSRARLVEVFSEDVSRLQAQIGRDLSSWLR